MPQLKGSNPPETSYCEPCDTVRGISDSRMMQTMCAPAVDVAVVLKCGHRKDIVTTMERAGRMPRRN